MTDSHHTLDIDGSAVPLRVRRNAQARRLILRLDDETGGAVVTIPKRTPIREAVDMAQRKSAWIAAQLKRRPVPVAFAPGAQIPYLGEIHTIRHDPSGRGIHLENQDIVVAGREEHLARRLADWLKAQAKAEISPRAHEKAEQLAQYAPTSAFEGWGLGRVIGKSPKPCRVGRITVRDTRSRWGSCAADGQLNFSWRLVMAPAFVLDYVVAHEVAHLAHRDHSPQFWAVTARLTDRMAEAKAWLNAHGRDLHRYG